MAKLHVLATSIFMAGVIALLGVNIGLYQTNNELTNQLSDMRFRVAQVEALANIDAQYTAIVEVLIAKGKDTLTERQIIEVAKVIHEQSAVHSDIGLKPSMILAFMTRESNFDPNAFSTSSAYGIMQLIRSTAEPHLNDLGLSWHEDLMYDPVINTRLGIAELIKLHRMYMSEGLETSDDWLLSTHSYFWGPRNTRILLTAKGTRPSVPSLEYSIGVRDIQQGYQAQGLL